MKSVSLVCTGVDLWDGVCVVEGAIVQVIPQECVCAWEYLPEHAHQSRVGIHYIHTVFTTYSTQMCPEIPISP